MENKTNKRFIISLLVIASWVSLGVAVWLSWHYVLLGAFFIHWAASLYPHSLFHHRYASHRQFRMSVRSEKLWFIASYILQGPSYLSAMAYGIMHRLHHVYADSPKDPHSPTFSPHLVSMMWKTRIIYNAICVYLFTNNSKRRQEAITTLALHNITEEDLLSVQAQTLPHWYAFDKFANSGVSRFLWLGIYAALYFGILLPWSGQSGWWSVTFVLHCIMAPAQGAVINWYAHTIGEVVFVQKNTSHNIAWGIDWFMLGEGYHNDHHKKPTSANFAFHNRWYVDPIYKTLQLLDKAGIITLVKV